MKQSLILNNSFKNISTRAFQLSLKDGRDIRSQYVKAKQVSFYKTDKLSKLDMIEFILRSEFSDSLVDEYLQNVNQWRKYEQIAVQDWIDTLIEGKQTNHE